MKYWWIFAGTLGSFVLFAGVVVGVLWLTDHGVGELGQFGDSFGAITSLFNSLVFASVVVTVLIQRDEFKLQREDLKLQHEQLKLQYKELRLQRRELEQTRAVLAKQEEQLAAQANVAKQQLFETTLFNLMNAFRLVAGRVRFGESEGVKAWEYFCNDLGHEPAMRRSAATPPDVLSSYLTWYRSNMVNVDGGYFNLLLEILNFIDRAQDDESRVKYARILRSQLSPPELAIIFHHGLDPDESPGTFRFFIKRYALLRNFRPEEHGLPANRNGWYGASGQLPGMH